MTAVWQDIMRLVFHAMPSDDIAYWGPLIQALLHISTKDKALSGQSRMGIYGIHTRKILEYGYAPWLKLRMGIAKPNSIETRFRSIRGLV